VGQEKKDRGRLERGGNGWQREADQTRIELSHNNTEKGGGGKKKKKKKKKKKELDHGRKGRYMNKSRAICIRGGDTQDGA